MFCCYAAYDLFWSDKSEYLFVFNVNVLSLCLVIAIGSIMILHSISKLTSKIEIVRENQDKFQKIIKKIQLQVQRLETSFKKTKSFPPAQYRDFESEEDIKIDSDSERKQLEFDIKERELELWKNDLTLRPLAWDILLKALHFPHDKNDKAGFMALELARKDNSISQLLRVSEDFLNLLAQDGIYLDDLKIEPPPIQAWLNFIKIDKNQHDRKLNCIGIEGHIKNLKLRAKKDTVFRDTALMLLRRFDKLLRDQLQGAEDHQIFKISETRSGKAFLIVGKISDTF